MNTKEKGQHIQVDPVIGRILQTYLGNVWPGFFRNRCTLKKCNENHGLVDLQQLRNSLLHAIVYALRFNGFSKFKLLKKNYQILIVSLHHRQWIFLPDKKTQEKKLRKTR